MQLRKIRIVPNYRKNWARKLAKHVGVFLKRHGFAIVHGKAEVTICIGGDGTIFYASHLKRISGAILGIGSKSSAVCQLRGMDWQDKILVMLKRGKIEKRLSLQAKFAGKTITAINDVVIHANDYRVISVMLDIGKQKHSFEGDGIIIASALGSGAYAYSAGGKLLPRSAKKIEIVPICPYKRKFRPRTVPANSSIAVHCGRSSSLIVDGILIGKVPHGERVIVKKGKLVSFLV